MIVNIGCSVDEGSALESLSLTSELVGIGMGELIGVRVCQ